MYVDEWGGLQSVGTFHSSVVVAKASGALST